MLTPPQIGRLAHHVKIAIDENPDTELDFGSRSKSDGNTAKMELWEMMLKRLVDEDITLPAYNAFEDDINELLDMLIGYYQVHKE